MVRVLVCHARSRGFEPRFPRPILQLPPARPIWSSLEAADPGVAFNTIVLSSVSLHPLRLLWVASHRRHLMNEWRSSFPPCVLPRTSLPLVAKNQSTIPPGLPRGGVKVPLGDCQSTRSWQSFSHWTTSYLLPKQ